MSTAENLEKSFQGETSEVGLYLAMAKRAEEEGLPGVSLYLKQVAWDEANHAAWVAAIQGKIKDTKSNLERMLNGEKGACGNKCQAAEEARKEGNEEAALFFEKASDDEKRHAAGLEGLLRGIG